MKIEILEEVNSTNEYLKKYLSFGEDRIAVAKRQTGGKGTKGRVFLSCEGGVYLSKLSFYKNLPAAAVFSTIAHAAVAVCKTAESYGLSPEIKWANDVYLFGKKLSGILAENIIVNDRIKAGIVGIGLNVCNSLGELGDIAITLSQGAGQTISTEEARERLIKNLNGATTFEDYLGRVRFLGRKVLVYEGARTYEAKAINIERDGRLLIECNGEQKYLSAAEISLKI